VFMKHILSRRGVSTILGTLIFVGILFSAYVPMVLVMKQADTIYEQRVHAAEVESYERELEDLLVLAYPNDADDTITVKATNEASVPIRVVRVWINDQCNTTDKTLMPGATSVVDSFKVDLSEEVFNVKVATERGNLFTSSSGSLYYDPETGYWATPTLAICVNIINFMGKYRIEVAYINGTQVGYYETQGVEFGDVIQTFTVPETGVSYVVTIQKHKGGGWTDLPGTPVTVEMVYPNGSPLVYVYADGTEI